jgi:hypothetical protein
MSNERSAAEVKAVNIALMGETLSAVYSELWQEVAWVHTGNTMWSFRALDNER